jgi:hypothetical protein
VYEELSGHGTYGRHNREYTVDELRTLLRDRGYVVVDVFAHDVHPAPANWEKRAGKAVSRDRGDNLFALAHPEGEPRWRYPRWLFGSRHALRRVVRPDLIMGINDDLQAWSLHPLEDLPGGCGRWTGPEPMHALLSTDAAGTYSLTVNGLAPPGALQEPLLLQAEVGGQIATWNIACDGQPFTVSATVSVPKGDQLVVLSTSRTWTPAALRAWNEIT